MYRNKETNSKKVAMLLQAVHQVLRFYLLYSKLRSTHWPS